MMYSAKDIDSSDALHLVSDTELDGVAGGRMKLVGPGSTPAQGGGAGGQSIDARWSQHPIYLDR
jgi:hypothetical protein